MKNSYSNIFPFNKKILNKTLKLLSKGNLLSLPTETVYGLAGNAYSNTAVKKIFKLKGRPKFNPLIIHYYSIQKIINDVVINNNFKKLYKKIMSWPYYFYLEEKKEL
jgi:L-threonylcarbamoyladenylate synthase